MSSSSLQSQQPESGDHHRTDPICYNLQSQQFDLPTTTKTIPVQQPESEEQNNQIRHQPGAKTTKIIPVPAATSDQWTTVRGDIAFHYSPTLSIRTSEQFQSTVRTWRQKLAIKKQQNTTWKHQSAKIPGTLKHLTAVRKIMQQKAAP